MVWIQEFGPPNILALNLSPLTTFHAVILLSFQVELMLTYDSFHINWIPVSSSLPAGSAGSSSSGSSSFFFFSLTGFSLTGSGYSGFFSDGSASESADALAFIAQTLIPQKCRYLFGKA
jgi:hypothetical protein